MKVMILAFCAIAVIAVGANIALKEIGFSAKDRTSGQAVRLDH